MKISTQLFGSACVLTVLLIGAAPANAAWWWPFGSDGIDYKVKISGVDKPTRKALEEYKLDKPSDANPPQNKDELEQEAVTHAEKIRKAMNTRGYYDALIQQNIDHTEKKPVIRYTVVPGKRYQLSDISMQWPGKPLRKLDLNSLESRKNAPIDVTVIQKDAETLLNQIGKDACLLSLNVLPLIKLYGANHKAELVFRVVHGEKANFGDPVIKGTQDVSDKVILRSVKWKKGDCFDQKKLQDTRDGLIQNQLLSSVSVKPADQINAQGQVPILIDVKERVPRTISAGANYSTDQGVGVIAGWEHRNFFGSGEKFKTNLTLAQQEQSINNELRIPYFMRDDQTLALTGGVKRENTDAYTTNGISTGATIERKLTSKLNSGIGIGYALTKTEDALQGNSQYGLLSFPGFLEYDTRDNAMDTHKGILGRVSVTPYTETFGDGGRFIKNQATVQTYLGSDEMTWKPTLALRLTAGSIAGSKGANIPSDIRFYAGGGGSVRGYSFQSLSPRLNGEPIGGASMLVGTTEMRLRFNDTIGAVAFVDAGNAYSSTTPDLSEKMYYGAGIGLRYFTAIGPLRLDVALPMNGKDIDETGYGLYVSLGQAF